MFNKVKWAIVSDEYLGFLRKYEDKIPYANVLDDTRMKAQLGLVVRFNKDFTYFLPLKSFQDKFRKVKNRIDFHKIHDGVKFYGLINLNNMFPVPKSEISLVDFDTLDDVRTFFLGNKERKDYWKLLNKELASIPNNLIIKNASNLYKMVTNNRVSKLIDRCCNFSLLEKKCLDYQKLKENNISLHKKLEEAKIKSQFIGKVSGTNKKSFERDF